MRLRAAILLLILLGVAVPASAQTPPADVNNPNAVAFTPSVDHAQLDRYDIEILRPDGSVLQTINAGKPVPDATNTCTVPLNVQPVSFGTGYSVRVRSVAGTAKSGDTEGLSQNKFNRVPGGPTKAVVK